MTITTNGETQKNNRRNDNCLFENSTQRLGDVEISSRSNGTEQDRAYYNDCSRAYLFEQGDGGNDSAGKILSRLKQLEEDYFAQINEYQSLLKSQLETTKQRESNFRQSVREIELDLQGLMSINDE